MKLVKPETLLKYPAGTVFSWLHKETKQAQGLFRKHDSFNNSANGIAEKSDQGLNVAYLLPLPVLREQDQLIDFVLQENQMQFTLDYMETEFEAVIIFEPPDLNNIIHMISSLNPHGEFQYEIGISPKNQMMLWKFTRVVRQIEAPLHVFEGMVKALLSKITECKALGNKIIVPGSGRLPPFKR